MLTSFIPRNKPDILVVILQRLTFINWMHHIRRTNMLKINLLELLKAILKTHLKNKVFLRYCIVCLFKYKRSQNITDAAQNFTFAKVYTNLE